MDRVWEANAVGTAISFPAGLQTGYASETPVPTIPGAWWYHQITEEIRAAIVLGGITPSPNTVNQLATAINNIANVNPVITGTMSVSDIVTFAANKYLNIGTGRHFASGDGATTNNLFSGGTGGLLFRNQADTTTIGSITDAGVHNALGAINTTDVSGTAAFSAITATTNTKTLHLQNTGGNLYVGVESSTGGSFLTGSSAYSAVFNNVANTSMHFGVNNTLRATLATTGLSVFGQGSFGAAVGVDRMFQVSGSAATTGATQYGAVFNPSLANTVTTSAVGLYVSLNVTAGATVASGYGLYIDAMNATGSTITNKWGLYVADTNGSYIAGNLGIGNGLNANWAAGFKAIQLGAGSAWMASNTTGQVYLMSNTYYDGAWKYLVTGQLATRYEQSNGNHTWYTAPSGTAGAVITYTQGLVLDTNTNLGLATVPVAWQANTMKALQLGNVSALMNYSTNNSTYLSNNWYSDGSTSRYITTNTAAVYQLGSGNHYWYTAASGTAGAALSLTQLMSLGSTGQLVQTITTSGASTVGSIQTGNGYNTIITYPQLTGGAYNSLVSVNDTGIFSIQATPTDYGIVFGKHNGAAVRFGPSTNPNVQFWTSLQAMTIDSGGNITALNGNINTLGMSTSWGVTNSTLTGSHNAVMGTASSSTWLLSGTSGGTFRYGIQGLDSGNQLRLYVGASPYLFNSGNFQVLSPATYTAVTSLGFNTAAITVPMVVVPNSGTNFTAFLEGSTYLNGAGYQQHVVFGSLRNGINNWSGGAIIALSGNAGNDAYPTEYYLFGISGSVSHSSGTLSLNGTVTAPTPTAGDNSTNVATTAFVTSNAVISGSIVYFARNTAPTGYLKANGALISRTTYAALFSAIGTTYGAGDGSTTFALPDLRGEFIRGWDDSRGVDTGRVFGSFQAGAVESHAHVTDGTLGSSQHAVNIGHDGSFDYGHSSFASSSDADYSGGSKTGTYGTATETRPRNVAVLACIKY